MNRPKLILYCAALLLAGASSAVGQNAPDLVCEFEARGRKVAFSWMVGRPAVLQVSDAAPAGSCELEPLTQHHAATAGLPRYVFSYSGKACLAKHPALREPVHELVTLIVYPEQGRRAQLFWSAIAPVEDCAVFDLSPAGERRARASRVD